MNANESNQLPSPPEEFQVPAQVQAKAKYWKRRHRKALAWGSIGFGVFSLVGIGLLGYGVSLELTPEYVPPAIASLEDFDGNYASLGNGPKIPAPVQDANHLPEVTLGISGGNYELDMCDGTFIHMIDYARVNDLQPTYAAHNYCRGDVVLDLQIGSRLLVNGVEYQVVSTRDLPRAGSNATQLLGMDGEIILQSCFYNSKWMHFIGVSPMVDPTDPTETPTAEPTTLATESSVSE